MVIELAQQMLHDALERYGYAEFFWEIGFEVRRAIIKESILAEGRNLRDVTPEEIAMRVAPRSLKEDMTFLNLPALVTAQGTGIRLMIATEAGKEQGTERMQKLLEDFRR